MGKFLALYLPQYHPIPENDRWYGKGFTEWRSVTSAKPLYRGHYQPHIPADLGFYDLRVEETLKEQVKLAKEYGVDGFCYWHYWFGGGKQLLEKPFDDLVNNKEIEMPFAVAWANASWEKKQWGYEGKNEKLIEQRYLGIKDYTDHFYSLLDAFKDERYIKVDGKLLFIIYRPLDSKEISHMIQIWRKLAIKENLKGFYFVGHDLISKDHESIINQGFDSIYDDNMLNIHHKHSVITKSFLMTVRKVFKIPTAFKYKNAIKYMITENSTDDNVIPVVVPNWDHTPRTGAKNIMFKQCEPKFFEVLLRNAIKNVKEKPEEKQLIIIKSWNEWGEGNHMEPDLKYGKGYLEALKKIRKEMNF